MNMPSTCRTQRNRFAAAARDMEILDHFLKKIVSSDTPDLSMHSYGDRARSVPIDDRTVGDDLVDARDPLTVGLHIGDDVHDVGGFRRDHDAGVRQLGHERTG